MYSVLNQAELRKKYGQVLGDISPFDAGIPLVEAEDKTLEEIYYFRWHTYCQQIKKTPLGYVVTEFLTEVPWAGIYNTINCPLRTHHRRAVPSGLYEGASSRVPLERPLLDLCHNPDPHGYGKFAATL